MEAEYQQKDKASESLAPSCMPSASPENKYIFDADVSTAERSAPGTSTQSSGVMFALLFGLHLQKAGP